MPCFSALQYGRAAEAALNTNHGAVLAVFARSFYVETHIGLACFGPVTMGAGPLNVLCDFPAYLNWQTVGLNVGQTVVCNYHDSISTQQINITLRQAKSWSPEPIHEYQKTQLTQGLQSLCLSMQQSSAPGLGCLIAYFCAVNEQPENRKLQSVINACVPLFHWLNKYISGQEQNFPVNLFSTLLGRGPGLTPSGDDFIGGMLITLYVLGYQQHQQRLSQLILPLAKINTNTISYHHLLCANTGQAAAILHKTIADICTGGKNLTSHLRAIDTIGHSSGWDALAGVTAACVAIVSSSSQTG